jgi:LuxR family maltose regulon positive regulatory protein
MGIDELARAAGVTTRNVRALQTQGLLPGPSLVGRTGVYDENHLVRLQAVLRLQAGGFNRAAIRELFAAWEAGVSLEDVLGMPAGRRRPASATTAFDLLVDSFPTWRGPGAGLLPGPLAGAATRN